MSTKDWLEKDYYKVLGVSKDASETEIKKAFHKIARENHPDAHPGDAKAEKRFKEASEAHSVLSDRKQRKEYDEARSLFAGPFGRFARTSNQAGPTNLDDLFARTRVSGDDAGLGDLFGNLFGGARRASQQTGRGPRRGADVEGEVSITFLQAVEGTTVPMQLVSESACSQCHGTGARAGSTPKVCPTCEGSGMQTSTTGGVFTVSEPCRDCRGRGLKVDDPCPECGGTGRGRSTRSMQVRIPAGVSDGARIRIKGKGSPGENGGAPGDLYVLVHVAEHGTFGRQGDNLTITVPVTFVEAALGAEIEVPTLQGPKVRIRIPQGTRNGQTFRARGKGVGRLDGSHGDLLVSVEVQVPQNLSAEAADALRAYAAKAHEPNPRAGM